MTVREIVETKLNGDNIPDGIVTLSILETEQAILSYCNINEMPESLVFTWANMSIDLIKYQVESTTAPQGGVDNIDMIDVSTLKIGDTQIGLQGGSGSSTRAKALSSHRPNLDSLVMNYKDQLAKYRRMVW